MSRTSGKDHMSERDRNIRRSNQNRALAFILAVIACFAVCIFLTRDLTGRGEAQAGSPVPGAAAAARTEEDSAQTVTAENPSAAAEEAAPEETPESAEAAPEESPENTEAAPEGNPENPEETPEDAEAAAQEAPEETEAAAQETPQWDLASLPVDLIPYGYVRENRDEANVPTDMFWYESQWGQYNVDWIQDTSQNVIYLTMDDGFPNETTARILDILREKDVKAVFFLTRQFVEGMPEIVQRMIDEGHQIGNHTCTHPSMPSLSVEEQTREILDLQDLVRNQFGYEMKYFRFPEGAFSEQSLGLVDNLGMKSVFWSYAYNDYSEEQPPVEESLWKAIGELHPGAIYLLHANSETNAAFLADFIDECRNRGFTFGEYPEAPH